jgi:hypothetical protein
MSEVDELRQLAEPGSIDEMEEIVGPQIRFLWLAFKDFGYTDEKIREDIRNVVDLEYQRSHFNDATE